MPGDGQEFWLGPHAPTRLTWPPGGVRQLAVDPQLLTVSGTPLHGLWLCLIEDQGYGRRRPRSRAGTCVVVCGGMLYVCTKDIGWRKGCQDVDRVGMEWTGRRYDLGNDKTCMGHNLGLSPRSKFS